MKIKLKFTLQIDIRNQTDSYFNLHLFFICCPSWLAISLIKFDLIKTVLFWSGNLKSNGNDISFHLFM